MSSWLKGGGVAVLMCLFPVSGVAQHKVACVGDSITAGFGIPKEERSMHAYPAVLQRLLGDEYEVRNFGASGRTLLRDEEKAWVKTGHAAKLVSFDPDIIILKLGTNDSKKAHWVNKADFEPDLKQFIEEFRQRNPDVHIFLCLPVPAFDRETHQLSDGESISGLRILNEVVPVLKRVALEERVHLIDLNTPLMIHSEYFPDGVHPNKAGAVAIAEMVHRELAWTLK